MQLQMCYNFFWFQGAEAKGNATHEQQLINYSKACVQPAYNYFHLKFNNDLKPVLDAFKAARLFSPSKFCLKAFPFLNSQPTIDGLKSEILTYMAASEDVPRLPTDINPVAWWKSYAMELPKWANAFRLVLSVQPSSAAAESLFNSTTHYNSAAVIFGGLPGTLCYVAIPPCSLDPLICACTLITLCKKGIFGKQNG